MKILSVTTSLSEDSSTLKLADRILTAAAAAGEEQGFAVETEHVNIRTLTTALTDMTLTGFRSEELEEAFAAVAEADAIVTVTPVYKVAPVGVHTLFWQLIDDKALAGIPVLIGSTGGTARHSLAAETVLRPVLSYLKGLVVPTSVFAATDDWGSVEGGRSLSGRIRQSAEELVTLTASVRGLSGAEADGRGQRHGPGELGQRSARPRRSLDDEFDPERITPFAQLLEG
ncbi:CE1759 family FMN reductase [Brevibacterium sp.]|uniref:CE1759 family FMN reductase n=1 Tax=Brevibacterium sp. TaxID=1701 RepID=UPI002811B9FE|nr:CE1759 family FMN reductase [Brevibacterium sp.]